ncbi:MAG: DUF4124 domain-containing protein [Deltaproteobacteria bacterium]
MKLLGAIIISASMLISIPALAQDAAEQQSPPSTNQTTEKAEVKTPDAPVIDNNGLVLPRKDLDNFEMSTLGSNGLADNKKRSTLSRNAERKTNAEVNKPREKTDPAPAEEFAVDETPYEPVEDTTGASEEYYEQSSALGGSGQAARLGKYFKWVDDNGVVHVTDDLGSVPLKYQEQIIKDAAGE